MEILDLDKIGARDLIVFDLDGTLIRTKSPMTADMRDLVAKLLAVKKIAVIGGGKYEVFLELFLNQLQGEEELLTNLFIFPTTSTAFYKYDNGWKQIYSMQLTPTETSQITQAFNAAFQELGYKHPDKIYGELIENRGTQVSFSVYGQDLVKILGDEGVKMKEKWLAENLETKMKLAELVQKKLPEFEVRAAGFTTIDVTRKGVDKAYGIHQINKHLAVPIEKMLFIGDAIFPGGNDYAVVRTGVDYISVKGPDETKEIIKRLIS